MKLKILSQIIDYDDSFNISSQSGEIFDESCSSLNCMVSVELELETAEVVCHPVCVVRHTASEYPHFIKLAHLENELLAEWPNF